MKDNEIRELLPDYVCGLLKKEEAATIDRLVQNSESLRKECEELRSYFNTLKSLKPVKAPNTFLTTVQKRVVVTSPIKKITDTLFRPFQVKVPLELAGLAATVVIIAVLFNPFDMQNMAPPDFEDTKDIEMDKTTAPAAVEEAPPEQPEAPAEKEAPAKVVKKEEKTVVRSKTAPKRKAKAAPKVLGSASSTAKRAKPPIKSDLASVSSSSGAKKGAGRSIGLFKTDESAATGGAATGSDMESEEGLSDDELFARAVIERSDSIVKRKKYPEPEPVDVGLLALSIRRKSPLPAPASAPESASRREMDYDTKSRVKAERKERKSQSRKKTAQKAPLEETVQSAEAAPQSASANELIFAQIESKIKQKKGKVTLLKDKPQTDRKKHYVVEILPSLFPELRQELEKEGVIIDKNFYFDSLQVELIQFNLIIDIK